MRHTSLCLSAIIALSCTACSTAGTFKGAKETQSTWKEMTACAERNKDNPLNSNCSERFKGRVITAQFESLKSYDSLDTVRFYAHFGDVHQQFACEVVQASRFKNILMPLKKGDIVKFSGRFKDYNPGYINFLTLDPCEPIEPGKQLLELTQKDKPYSLSPAQLTALKSAVTAGDVNAVETILHRAAPIAANDLEELAKLDKEQRSSPSQGEAFKKVLQKAQDILSWTPATQTDYNSLAAIAAIEIGKGQDCSAPIVQSFSMRHALPKLTQMAEQKGAWHLCWEPYTLQQLINGKVGDLEALRKHLTGYFFDETPKDAGQLVQLATKGNQAEFNRALEALDSKHGQSAKAMTFLRSHLAVAAKEAKEPALRKAALTGASAIDHLGSVVVPKLKKDLIDSAKARFTNAKSTARDKAAFEKIMTLYGYLFDVWGRVLRSDPSAKSAGR